MPIAVSIPTPLRPLTDNLDTVEVEGATVTELLSALDTKYPASASACSTRRATSAASLTSTSTAKTSASPGQGNPRQAREEVSIVPAIAGG